jgi:hypothetical protein
VDAAAAYSQVNLASAVNCDLPCDVANKVKVYDSAAYTIPDNSLVLFKWAKDAAGTALKYLYITGVMLIRQ